jgi:hypothetical protein
VVEFDPRAPPVGHGEVSTHDSFGCYLGARILAISQWRNNLIAKRDASDGMDKSVDDLIADADAYIHSLQQKIDAINRSAKG